MHTYTVFTDILNTGENVNIELCTRLYLGPS